MNLRYLKEKTLMPIISIVKQFGEWFTPTLVSYFSNATFDYKWVIPFQL